MRRDANTIRLSRSASGLVAIAIAVGLVAALGGCTAPQQPATSVEPAPAVTRQAAPAGELSSSLRGELETVLEQTMAEYDVPGAAAGVWIPGEGSWTTAAGLADIDAGIPATTDMTWPLRSITKSYTVTLVLQLVDEGVVSLDDTIDQYVEGVTGGDRITLRELANMSSGNADYTNAAFVEAFTADPSRIFTLEELNGFMLGEPARFAPGERRVYTNANTNLLGAAVEAATGQAFADVLRERILDPLGQTEARYLVDAREWSGPHPIGYAPGDEGLTAQSDNLSVYGPAGSMVSDLDDARAWVEALATGAFLTEQTQAARLEGAPLEVGPPYDRYALGIGETDGWWGHNGEGFGFTAAAFHDPESGASIVVFMNESNVQPKAHPADQAFRRIAQVLRDASIT